MKETEPKEEKPENKHPTPLETFIKSIEEACEFGHLWMDFSKKDIIP